MSRYVLTLLALVALTSVGIVFFATRSRDAVVSAAKVDSRVSPPPASPTFDVSSVKAAPESRENVPVPAPTEIVDVKKDTEALDPFAADRKAIRALGASGDPAQVPVLATYLNRAEATLRDEACLALVVLGDLGAVPFLNAAAAKSTSPVERSEFQEAVRVLSLPKE